MRVHFYDVSQALAALVELPDGRIILVDAGDEANRAGCGNDCKVAHAHLLDKLKGDLGSSAIDLMWITHTHSDHMGGAVDVLEQFQVLSYVDNGRDKTVAEIKALHDEVKKKHIAATAVSPGQEAIPWQTSAEVKLTAIAPSSWLPKCTTDRNDCSIMLRIDYCKSSVLFAGDAEVEEEALLDPHGPATLLQVGHHGSDTSSGEAFIKKVQPKYAVISSGKKGEGMNTTYCHPRASTVTLLTEALGGPGSKKINAFDAKVSCSKTATKHWSDVPASDALWATERDGDVVLSTTGDGVFSKL